MVFLRSSLRYCRRLLRYFKNCALVAFWCLIILIGFQSPTFAETTIYSADSTYTIFDDSLLPITCAVTSLSTKQVTTYSVSNRAQCMSFAAISSNTLPKFSDTVADLSYSTKNTFSEAVILLCWSDVFSFLFFCLVLFLFAQVLPG